MPRPVHILIAGGGTGGHVYPAIAIADAIRSMRPDARVVFAGTQERLEATAVPEAGYAMHPITVAGFQRGLSVKNLTFPVKLAKGIAQSWRLVGSIDPDVAVGTGGYVSGPVLLAAWLRGCPLVIQEQNAYAGVTNRILSLMASRVHLAFDEAKDWVPEDRAVVSGNPTRDALRDVDAGAARSALGLPHDADVLFVFGGSLGSQALNDAMLAHVETLLDDASMHVIWQTGSRYAEDIQNELAGTPLETHPRLQVQKYVTRMDRAYAAADLALCRAGAITCSELMVTGTPAILVPSPNVTADHQTKNARSMERGGAARLLPESELTSRLVEVVRNLMADTTARTEMSEAARRMARPDAARTIAEDVLRLADDHSAVKTAAQ